MTLKAAVKGTIGRVARTPPMSARTRGGLRRRINVVYLHYVGEPRAYLPESYRDLTLERFDRDLALLGRYFEFCPLRDVVLDERGNGSRPRLAVTFDDGCDLLAGGAAEVLERHEVKATTFVVTSTVDNDNLMWTHKLSAVQALRDENACVRNYNELMATAGLPEIGDASRLMQASLAWPTALREELVDRLWDLCDMPPLAEYLAQERPYFTWDGLTEWIARGHDVGLHTHSHPHCSRLSPDAIEDEVVEPAAVLRERLGLDYLPFAYPFGDRLDEATERRLYDAGVFDGAFGIGGFARRRTPPHRLERSTIEIALDYGVFGKAFLGLPR